MPLTELTEFLESNETTFSVLNHPKAYTAQEVAARAHIPGEEMAKPVMANIDGEMVMLVVPSTHRVDFDRLKEVLGVKEAELATEKEFEDRFPDCELGAMPPFGNLFDMDTYVDQALTEDEEIAFNAGNHRELVQLQYQDYEDLVQPEVVPLAMRND